MQRHYITYTAITRGLARRTMLRRVAMVICFNKRISNYAIATVKSFPLLQH